MDFVPNIIKTESLTLNSDKHKKAEIEAYIKDFDPDTLRKIANAETGEYDFDESHTVYGIENYLASHGFSINARGEDIVGSIQGVKRVDFLIRTITACKEFMATREREAEEEARREEEEAEKERLEKERLAEIVRKLFEEMSSGELEIENLSTEEKSILMSLIAKSGLGAPLDLLSRMTALEKKIFSDALANRIKEEADGPRGKLTIQQLMQGREKQTTVSDIMAKCLRDPKAFYGLARTGEDPKTVLNFLSEYVIKPKLGIETGEDGGSLPELLMFLQEPIMDEVAGILAAAIEAYMALQNNEVLKAAKLELKKQQIADYCETLKLMKEAEIKEDVAVQLLCAQIGKPSSFPSITVPINNNR